MTDRRFETPAEVIGKTRRGLADFRALVLARLGQLRADIDAISTFGVFQAWTPTLVNLNVGTTGGVVAVYAEVIDIVYFDVHVVLGGTGISVGSEPNFSVPIPEWAEYNIATDDRVVVGEATIIDSTVSIYDGVVTIDDGVLRPRALLASGTNATQQGITNLVPFTWAANDRMWLHGWYRKAP